MCSSSLSATYFLFFCFCKFFFCFSSWNSIRQIDWTIFNDIVSFFFYCITYIIICVIFFFCIFTACPEQVFLSHRRFSCLRLSTSTFILAHQTWTCKHWACIENFISESFCSIYLHTDRVIHTFNKIRPEGDKHEATIKTIK